MNNLSAISAMCLLSLAAGCSPLADDENTLALMSAKTAAAKGSPEPIEAALATAREDCLLMVWSNLAEEGRGRAIEFDRSHDQVEGGAISCATGTSPSQFDAAITAIREAARSGNKARMLTEIGMPLVYIDANGERQPLEDREMVEAMFDDVFDAHMLDMLGKLSLKDMTVVPEQGAFFELGSLWLVVDETGGRPKIFTVNHQAMSDAAKAAAKKAQRGEGKTLPDD